MLGSNKMSLGLFDVNDIKSHLESIYHINEWYLKYAEALGADPRDISLVKNAIIGTLDALALSFGLELQVGAVEDRIREGQDY